MNKWVFWVCLYSHLVHTYDNLKLAGKIETGKLIQNQSLEKMLFKMINIYISNKKNTITTRKILEKHSCFSFYCNPIRNQLQNAEKIDFFLNLFLLKKKKIKQYLDMHESSFNSSKLTEIEAHLLVSN